MTFVWTASNGLYSHAGTCLSAAAWTITSTPRVATRSRSRSRTSPSRQRSRRSRERLLELGLLELVAAEDADRGDVVAREHGADEGGAERARPARDQQGLSARDRSRGASVVTRARLGRSSAAKARLDGEPMGTVHEFGSRPLAHGAAAEHVRRSGGHAGARAHHHHRRRDNSSFATQLQSASAASLTGTPAPASTAGQAIVNLVRNEVGVAEQPPGSNDSPRIAQFRQATAGSGVGPWCAYFTSWAAREAGVPLGDNGQGFGRVDDVYAGRRRPARRSRTARASRPQPGDLIVWDEHIGVVESVGADGTINTIEGNSSDQVSQRVVRAGLAPRDRLRAPGLVGCPQPYAAGMPDPETEELQLEQLDRERAERKQARFSHDEPRGAHARAPRRPSRVPARQARRARASPKTRLPRRRGWVALVSR